MDVLIVEISTGRLISKIPVVCHGMNYPAVDEEYFSEAWRCAVKDGLVNAERRYEYRFQLDRAV